MLTFGSLFAGYGGFDIGPMEEDVEYRVNGDVLEGRRVDGE